MKFSLHPAVTFAPLGPNIPLRTLYYNTLSLYSSHNVRASPDVADKISHS
jgi:hypothetical protein